MALVLYGFRFSVYVRIAPVALTEKGLAYEHVDEPRRRWPVYRRRPTVGAVGRSE
jgi:glutathione S-transferase